MRLLEQDPQDNFQTLFTQGHAIPERLHGLPFVFEITLGQCHSNGL